MCSPAIPEARSAVGSSPWLDRLGMATSTICAIHCAATALFMGALSAVGAAGVGAAWVEGAFLAAAVLLGVLSLGHALFRHRSYAPMAWFSAGMLLLLVVRPLAPSAVAEVLAVIAGATLVVRAHWHNARLLAA
jgi:hypothetical protein